MWKAKLVSVQLDASRDIDALKIGIEFYHTDGRTGNKNYILWADELAGVTLSDLRAGIAEDLDRLNKMETAKTTLSSYIGQDI